MGVLKIIGFVLLLIGIAGLFGAKGERLSRDRDSRNRSGETLKMSMLFIIGGAILAGIGSMKDKPSDDDKS